MKFKINAIQIEINTDKGLFGQKVCFENGLNIIRAENTSGKSTLINSIIYALGFERLLGNRKGYASLKPVLKTGGAFKDLEFSVLESNISLEIENAKSEGITIKRAIIGTGDTDLITTYKGRTITFQDHEVSKDYYYVNREGSAQRQAGFHSFLANFLDLELPFVSRFSGNDVPLYLECIIPLMFIEQIRGWTGVQATIPKNYGIQNVNKNAIEFLLDLDAQKIKKQHEELEFEHEKIKGQWISLRQQFNFCGKKIGAVVSNYPEKPQGVLNIIDLPKLIINTDDKEISIEIYLRSLRERLSELLKVPKNDGQDKDYNQIESQIIKYENTLIVLKGKLKELNTNLVMEQNTIDSLSEQVNTLEKEIKRYTDLKRLLEMGAEFLDITKNHCPTCKQTIDGSLVNGIGNPMPIDDNIAFLTSQKNAINLLMSTNTRNSDIINARKTNIETEIKKIKSNLISLQRDSISANDISEYEIRKKIAIEEEIHEVETVINSFDELIEKLKDLSKVYDSFLKKKASMPVGYFSLKDEKKLEFFKNAVRNLLIEFGYRSTLADKIELSKDNYQPVCNEEGFELALDASATDNVRIVWAYTVALMLVSANYLTNHLGIAILDEPEQQRMKEASSEQLYISLSALKQNGFQSIIATSEDKNTLKMKLKGIDCQILEFGDEVIKPKNLWMHK